MKERMLIGQVAAAALAVLFAAAALALGLSVHPLETIDVVRAVTEAAAVLLPVVVGIYAMRREQTARFACLLVIAGLAWAPSALALSGDSLPYSIGRVWSWGVLVWIVYLLLAFPAGRLTTRTDRWVVAAGVGTLALLYLPSALIAEFPTPSPWNDCTTACPPNAFMVTATPAGETTAIIVLRDVLSMLVFAAGAARVAVRWRSGARVARRVHGPVFAMAVLYLLASAAFL